MNAKGSVFKYPDNVDTDVIIPARHLNTQDAKELASHCMEDIDKDFASTVQPGDIIVADENFGCGSSREHAPIAIKAAGVDVVIAKSFARIHAANLINAGILPLTFADPADYDALAQGAHLRIDNIRAGMAAGALTLTDTATGKTYPVVCSLTGRQQAILLAGGLLNYTKEHAL